MNNPEAEPRGISLIVIQKKYLTDSVQDEDVLLLEFLKKKGLDIHREVWTDENVNWANYNQVLLKPTWDYLEKIETFYNWLDKLKNLSVHLLNPYKIIKWNSDKHYLKDIVQNTFKHDFVIDLDIKSFFDTIDHKLLMEAVRFYCKDKWILLYVERWLKSGIVQQDGNHIDRLVLYQISQRLSNCKLTIHPEMWCYDRWTKYFSRTILVL